VITLRSGLVQEEDGQTSGERGDRGALKVLKTFHKCWDTFIFFELDLKIVRK